MNSKYLGFSFAAIALACALAACGGGGGGTITPSTNPPSTPTPTPSPVTGTGTLVDQGTGLPIAGATVGLAPNTPGATPVPQPSTNASGQFTVTAPAAGTYMLVISGNANQSVIHHILTLTAGANTLTAPNIGPAPGATPNAVQSSGNFRLATLTAPEVACLAYVNQARSNHTLSAVTTDEWLTEDNRGYWTVATATNSFPAYPKGLGYPDETGNGATCQPMIDDSFAGLNFGETYPSVVWFAGDSGGTSNVATDESMADPRGPLPTPTPANPWP
jgi:hypothetical protein